MRRSGSTPACPARKAAHRSKWLSSALARLLSSRGCGTPVLLALAASASTAAGVDRQTGQSPRTFNTAGSFTFENDLFFQTDRYYTDGVQLTIKRRDVNYSGRLADWANAVCNAFGCPSERAELVRHKFGQLMYTPVRIAVAEPQPFDRPWAGMLHYTREHEYVSDKRDSRTTISGTIGVIGPGSGAKQTQKWIHRTFSGDPPGGWDNQIGGELGLMALVERRRGVHWLSTSNAEGVQFKSTGSVRAAVGNIMTFVGVGATLTVGKDLDSAIERNDISFKGKQPALKIQSTDSGQMQTAASRTCVFNWLECSAYVSAEVRWMIRNVFLDGAMFRSGPSVDSKPLVADATFGVRLDFPRTRTEYTGPWYVGFAATRRSPEFSSRRGSASAQSFGALTVGTEF